MDLVEKTPCPKYNTPLSVQTVGFLIRPTFLRDEGRSSFGEHVLNTYISSVCYGKSPTIADPQLWVRADRGMVTGSDSVHRFFFFFVSL